MSLELSRIWLGFQHLFNDLLATVPNLLLALIVLTPFWLAARSVKALVQRFPIVRQHQYNLGLVLGRLAQWGINGAGILVALSIVLPSFKASDLIQLLGIGGVAIGFAFRDILQNFLAGILLLLTEPFRIGDQIAVRTFEGTVEDIQTRATMLRTYDGRRVVIPNSSLFTESVTVHTAFAYRRLEYDFSVGSDAALEPLQAQLLQAIQSVAGVLPEPAPDVLVVKLDNASVTLRLRWWISPAYDAHGIEPQDRVLRALHQTLQAQARQAAATTAAPLTPAPQEALPGSPPADSPVAASAPPSGASVAGR
jgi:small-conductance mechanosensitive channel